MRSSRQKQTKPCRRRKKVTLVVLSRNGVSRLFETELIGQPMYIHKTLNNLALLHVRPVVLV